MSTFDGEGFENPANDPSTGTEPEQEAHAAQEEEEEEVAAALHRLEIIARRRVQSLFAGEYQSAFKGRGMAFSDFRLYQPGDEIRWIDWKVSARMGETYIKQFVEERERTVLLLWDASSSMDLGTRKRTKRELSAELAMLLAMSAIRNNDRVGMIIFHDRIEKFIAPKKGRKHVMRLIKDLLTFQTPDRHEGEKGLQLALQFLHHVVPRHTIAFVISDFLLPQETQLWQVVGRKNDLISIVVYDPLEQSLLPQDAPPLEQPLHDEENPDQEAPPSPAMPPLWTTLLVAVTLLSLGLWQGGLWLWSATAAACLLALGHLFLQRTTSAGIVALRDLETQAVQISDLGHKTNLSSFAEHAASHHTSLRETFQQSKVDSMFLRTDQDYLPALLSFFRERKSRMVR